jgi:hypothetical protein
MAKLVMSIVVSFMLAAPSHAEAECAWVLWTRVMVPSMTPGMVTADPWRPTHRLGTLQECTDLLLKMDYQFDTGGGWMHTRGNRTWQAVCVPDTVDPRGPKGGR